MTIEDKAWSEYQEKFAANYDEFNYASPLQSWTMHKSHKLVENAYEDSSRFKRVLEIGAGTGEHLSFVRHSYDEYIISDLDQEALDVARTKIGSVKSGQIKFEVQSGAELTYADNTFDRLIAVHVLEHIYQPHIALKEWARVLKPGGVLSVLIPTDPGIAWQLGRKLGPRRNAIEKGIAYDYVMAREHVNSCHNLIAFLRHYFHDSHEAWWPLPIPSINLNLFFAYHATLNKNCEP